MKYNTYSVCNNNIFRNHDVRLYHIIAYYIEYDFRVRAEIKKQTVKIVKVSILTR